MPSPRKLASHVRHRLVCLSLCAALVGCAGSRRSEPPTSADWDVIRAELLVRVEQDQAIRREAAERFESGGRLPEEFGKRWHAIDADNTAWIRGVLELHGWPPRSRIGEEASSATFLLVQHADAQPEFQREALALLSRAVEADEASPKNLAYLTDRVRVAAGDPQVYGTQVRVEAGKAQPYPLEDPDRVDERRAAVGLGPLSEYLKLFD